MARVSMLSCYIYNYSDVLLGADVKISGLTLGAQACFRRDVSLRAKALGARACSRLVGLIMFCGIGRSDQLEDHTIQISIGAYNLGHELPHGRVPYTVCSHDGFSTRHQIVTRLGDTTV
ncbi:hypothetical protein EPI10_002847 [Gossypium australe]|uniref:Uncharacterized protein n=1 Tax=Gossypium australe TaxID=47621 RepID=A0A5B6VF51_9ROSI|nr:hypothetical protein EPI10_002847 [Gossypium australe]